MFYSECDNEDCKPLKYWLDLGFVPLTAAVLADVGRNYAVVNKGRTEIRQDYTCRFCGHRGAFKITKTHARGLGWLGLEEIMIVHACAGCQIVIREVHANDGSLYWPIGRRRRDEPTRTELPGMVGRTRPRFLSWDYCRGRLRDLHRRLRPRR